MKQDFSQAFLLYQRSAEQGNPYASYELAKMFRDGVGTEPDPWQSKEQFEKAFIGFSALEMERMLWVQRMNNIRSAAMEIVANDLIYC